MTGAHGEPTASVEDSSRQPSDDAGQETITPPTSRTMECGRPPDFEVLHHSGVFVFQVVAVVDEHSRVRIKSHQDADNFARVHQHRVLPSPVFRRQIRRAAAQHLTQPAMRMHGMWLGALDAMFTNLPVPGWNVEFKSLDGKQPSVDRECFRQR